MTAYHTQKCIYTVYWLVKLVFQNNYCLSYYEKSFKIMLEM